jgi:hypothetical protein
MRPRTLVLLVVAAARAWDFPWSSTEEGWAPAPEEDPFWVDREPCEAEVAVLAAYAWLYAKNRSKIARVDEETSLLSQTEENPFDPHNGLEITKF